MYKAKQKLFKKERNELTVVSKLMEDLWGAYFNRIL